MNERSPVKRISIMIGEEQYERLSKAGFNISAFIRDLIQDHFSDDTITLSVSRATRDLYNKVVSHTGATDEDIEPLFVKTLAQLLDERIEKIRALKSEFKK